jgi:hypothetical protein
VKKTRGTKMAYGGQGGAKLLFYNNILVLLYKYNIFRQLGKAMAVYN